MTSWGKLLLQLRASLMGRLWASLAGWHTIVRDLCASIQEDAAIVSMMARLCLHTHAALSGVFAHLVVVGSAKTRRPYSSLLTQLPAMDSAVLMLL